MGKRVKRGSSSFVRFLALLIIIGIVALVLWVFSPDISVWVIQNQKLILTIVSGFALAYTVFRFIFNKPRHSFSKFLLWIFLMASAGYLLWIYVVPPVLLWIRLHLAITFLSIAVALLVAISLAIRRYKPDIWKSILTRIKTWFGPEPQREPKSSLEVGSFEPEKEGYVYLCRCEALEDNLHKIGKTKRHPKERIIEISAATGVPEEYHLEDHWKVTNYSEAESKIFKALDSYRPNKKREFFKARLTIIIPKILDTIKELIINEEPGEEYGGAGVIPTSPLVNTAVGNIASPGNISTSDVSSVSNRVSERKELDTLMRSTDYTNGKLIGFFKRNLADEYESDAGVWEKIPVEVHTQRVLKQFDKYFNRIKLPVDIDPMFFRIILALHDVGVSHAIEQGSQEGKDTRSAKKMYQATFNEYFMKRELDRLQFSTKEINLASALVSADPIGYYLRKDNIKNAANTIKRMAIKSGLKTEEFFKLLRIFYMVDAGSYTIDAGGQKGLDHLFEFNHSQMRMYFARNIAYKIDKLWKHLQSK